MEDNEPDDLYYYMEPHSPTSSPPSKSSTDSNEGIEIPLNQQVRIDEINSVTGDLLGSLFTLAQNVNGNGMYEPSTSGWRRPPSISSNSNDNHPTPFVTEDDHPMETIRGDSSPILEGSDEDAPTVHRSNLIFLHSIDGMEPSDTVRNLRSRAEAFIEELLRSLLLSRSDYPPPPGRLPVSFSPELPPPPSIQMKISLKKRTASIIQLDRNIPPKFRNENDRNKGLPTMDVSAQSIDRWFDQACRHFEFWVTRLRAVMDNVKVGDENLDPEEFAEAFQLFQREFLDFDEMVTFALEGLRPLVGPDDMKDLNERHRCIQSFYCKLEIAFLTGRLKDENYISNVSEGIDNVLRTIWSIYATD